MTAQRRCIATLAAVLSLSVVGLNAPSTAALSAASRVEASIPAKAPRLLDTRAESQVGYTGGRPAAGTTLEVQAPVGAEAVALNIVGLNAAETGFVTAYPCMATRPTVSNLNLTPGLVNSNMAIVGVGVDRKVCIFTQRSADLVVDFVAALGAGDGYHPVEPVRVLDTRPDSAIGFSGTKPSPGEILRVAAPAGAAAVVLNVTGLDADQEAFVTVFPCGEPVPTASNLNLTPGVITPNLTITKVGADGNVCIFTQRSAHLIADLAGSFSPGATYTALTPQRVLDTRPESWVGGYGVLIPGKIWSSTSVYVTAPVGATAVALNVTAVEPGPDATVYAYQCDVINLEMSGVSVLWQQPTDLVMIRPAFAIARVGSDGRVCLLVNNGGFFAFPTTHLVVDLVGVFSD